MKHRNSSGMGGRGGCYGIPIIRRIEINCNAIWRHSWLLRRGLKLRKIT